MNPNAQPQPVTPPQPATPEADLLAKPKSKQKRIAVGVLAGGLILLAGGYFGAVPYLQVNDYKKTASSHNAVNDKMVRVYDNFKRDGYTKVDTKVAADKVDMKYGRDAVEDAKAALDANEKNLTKFTALPLLGWNSQYKTATETDAKEESYVKQSRAFLADYTAMLDYFDKTVILKEKVVAIETDLNTIETAKTPEAMAKQLDAVVVKIEGIVKEQKALTPPSYLKAAHTQEIESANELIVSLKSLSSAVKVLDLEKIDAAATDMEKQSDEYERQAQVTINSLQSDSLIAKSQTSLRALHQQIVKAYASL